MVVNRMFRIGLLLTVLTAIGTAGLMLIEGQFSFLDALYMTIITLTTVGFQEVHPLSEPGRMFVIALLVLGLGVFLYALVQFGELIAGMQMAVWLEKRKMDSTLSAIKEHFIICGLSRVGIMVCERLANQGVPFVVVDKDEERLSSYKARGWHWCLGDATDDEVLESAGIRRAKGLAAVLPSDADNLFVVFTGRMLRKDLRILARATDAKQEAKLEKAGADRVVSPFAEGATKIMQFLTNPHVLEFLELVSHEGSEMDLVEFSVSDGSDYAGKRLRETDFGARGIVIVGIRKVDGSLLMPPPADTLIETADSLISFGNATAIKELCAEP